MDAESLGLDGGERRVTRLNWSRGAKRLWLVISVVWVAFFAVIYRPDRDIQQYLELNSHESSASQTGGLRSGETASNGAEARPAVTDFAAALRLSERRPRNADGDMQRVVRARERAVRQLELFAWTAFLPPLALFLLGASFAWAIRGFVR